MFISDIEDIKKMDIQRNKEDKNRVDSTMMLSQTIMPILVSICLTKH